MKIISIATGIALAATAAEAAVIADWSTCQAGDTCSSAGYSCCVATADSATGKMTCRPTGASDCVNNGHNGFWIGDWGTCYQGDACTTSGYRCCVHPNDVGSGKSTCRPNTVSECSTRPVACRPSRYQANALATNQRNAASVTFAGTSSFFLHTIPSATQDEMLNTIRDAGLKVIRVFISKFYINEKGSGNIRMDDIENVAVGTFNNTQLDYLNTLMLKVSQRGLKLIIVPHDRYMLGTFKTDQYATKYLGLVGDPTGPSFPNQNVRALYTNTGFGADIDRRYAYIANYLNPNFANRRIGDIHEAIFGFDMQNEAQAYNDGNSYTPAPSNPNWVCDRATALKPLLHPNILTLSGGGARVNDSAISAHFSCAALDVIALHSYYTSDFASKDLTSIMNAALLNKKRVIIEEFGSTGASKATNLQSQINIFNSFSLPWMFWQTMKPGSNTNNYETYSDDTTTWSTITTSARNTNSSTVSSAAKFCFIQI